MKRAIWIRSMAAAKVLAREQALADGAEALGYELHVLPSMSGSPSRNLARNRYDFAFCSGMRSQTARARRACSNVGVPVAIVELGFLKRSHGETEPDGYFQLCWNKLCNLPSEAPGDRWEALGLELVEHHAPGDKILVGMQVGHDAQHNLPTDELERWLMAEARKQEYLTGLPAIWRQHPRQMYVKPAKWRRDRIQNPTSVPLQKALDEAAMVVTYNSTLGVDAILKGIPVMSHPSAHYHKHAVADKAVRLAYLHRLAYAQWNLDELKSGKALEHLLGRRPGK